MKFDVINYWSELKLEIVRKYASAYSTILAAQTSPRLYHIYVDAFSGAGLHISKRTNDWVLGSPLNALNVSPAFKEFHLIDLDRDKSNYLRRAIGKRDNVFIYNEDCNKILIDKVFPACRFEDYRRALCLLDPYGLHLNWQVTATAGQMKSVEIFLNFPLTDMNRNVLWADPDSVEEEQRERMNSFWGDDSWRKVVYDRSSNLFGFEEKTGPKELMQAFRHRLKRIAGFSYVPEPIPMRNSKSVIMYYLFFASQNPVAANIVTDIFNNYRNRIG